MSSLYDSLRDLSLRLESMTRLRDELSMSMTLDGSGGITFLHTTDVYELAQEVAGGGEDLEKSARAVVALMEREFPEIDWSRHQL